MHHFGVIQEKVTSGKLTLLRKYRLLFLWHQYKKWAQNATTSKQRLKITSAAIQDLRFFHDHDFVIFLFFCSHKKDCTWSLTSDDRVNRPTILWSDLAIPYVDPFVWNRTIMGKLRESGPYLYNYDIGPFFKTNILRGRTKLVL